MVAPAFSLQGGVIGGNPCQAESVRTDSLLVKTIPPMFKNDCCYRSRDSSALIIDFARSISSARI